MLGFPRPRSAGHSIVFNADSSTVAVIELFGTASSESLVSVLSSAFTSTANPQAWQESTSTLKTFSMQRGYRTPQLGNRFVSFVRARGVRCLVEVSLKSHAPGFPLSFCPLEAFPFPF